MIYFKLAIIFTICMLWYWAGSSLIDEYRRNKKLSAKFAGIDMEMTIDPVDIFGFIIVNLLLIGILTKI